MSRISQSSSLSQVAKRYAGPLIACATLGLAPFVPEPHIVGKLRWLLGGAEGMGLVDWADLGFHAAPWLWLGSSLSGHIVRLVRGQSGSSPEPTRIRSFIKASLIGAVICVLWALAHL